MDAPHVRHLDPAVVPEREEVPEDVQVLRVVGSPDQARSPGAGLPDDDARPLLVIDERAVGEQRGRLLSERVGEGDQESEVGEVEGVVLGVRNPREQEARKLDTPGSGSRRLGRNTRAGGARGDDPEVAAN